MSRKTSHTDLKLLDAGRKLLIKKGASSLSIRELTTAADVNLGMFSYYFKTKDIFVKQLLENIYDEFISALQLEDDSTQPDPIILLRHQLMTIATFARDNRVLILSLLNDVLDEQAVVQQFARTSMKKHFLILAKTLKQCQQNKTVIKAPIPLLITHIVGGLGLSNLVPELLKRTGASTVFKVGLAAVTKKISSDKALQLRVEMVLNGLTPINMEKSK